ncbi:iron ABC transporter permease [Mesorhizobium sp. YR577]|jgi:iron(III) transport system permease protein|uniref:ABC transporter permease n=1 Tax=Mesorhizobium sp. YR577 TaxID=1884373 RepID=UPI0008E4F354|nr:iron ABC transporter permease [Mesorhizobium sp. YR577]SFT47625.1 iron(III) transport system permease protein [Mesorhizobium sp. YR577]
MASIDIQPSASAQGRSRIFGWLSNNLTLIFITALILLMVVLPVIRLVISSFQEGHPAFPDGWTLDNYGYALTQPNLLETLGRTFWIAAIGTLFALCLAVLLAFLVERTDMPFRNLAWMVIIIPMAMPGILFAMGWALLLSPNSGALNVALRGLLNLVGLDIGKGPIDIFSVGGLIFLDSIRGVTTIFLMVVGSFRMMDPTLEEAAMTSKANRIKTFLKVTLPVLAPAILAAGMYSFILSMESFESALAVGLPGGVFVLSTMIYFTTRVQAPIDYGLAAVYGVLFMLLMMLLLLVYRRSIRHAERFTTVTGKGFRPRIISIGKWRYAALAVVVVYFIISTVLPFAILLWTSLLPSYRPPSWEALQVVSIKNFVTVFSNDQIVRIVWNTFLLMIMTATITTLLSFFASWMIVRNHGSKTISAVLDYTVFMPLAVPGIVTATALMMAFLTPPLNRLGIYGTIWIVVLGLTISYLPFCTRLMNGAIMQIHKELEQAAYVCGATVFKTMMRITLPLLFPAFAAGWIWVAVHALRAFAIPLMLSGRDNKVFAVYLWENWEQYAPVAAAMGVIMVIILIPLTMLLRRFISQISRQN